MSNKIGCMLCRLAKAWQPAQQQLLRIASFFVCVVLLFSLMPIDSFAAEAQEFLVYNGYELPAPPEGVTDYIIFNPAFDGSTVVKLYECSDFTVFYENDKLYLNVTGFYNCFGDIWGSRDESTSKLALASSGIIFSTQDIYYQGTDDIYFRGSEPLSIADATLYSYNGFLAPAIPSYMSNPNYPYYCISYYKGTSFTGYTLTNFADLPKVREDGHFEVISEPSKAPYTYFLKDGAWEFINQSSYEFAIYRDTLVWSNVDFPSGYGYEGFEASEPVFLGYEANVFTIVSQDDDYSLETGQSSLLQLYNPRGISAKGDWSISGNTSSNTSIIENSPDENGLAISATLQISEYETASKIVVYCSFINSYNRFTTKSFFIDIVPPSDASYSIIQTGNLFPEFVAGKVYSFSVIDVHNPSPTPLSAEWAISGENINEFTTINSGTLSISVLQQPTTITITASNIDNSGKSATYVLNTVSSGFVDGEGDSGSDATNQDVVDSVNNGFTDLGNKIETGLDNLGNNIVTNIIDALFRFFVPTAEELTAQMNSFVDWINTNYPILGVPMEFVSYTYDLFFGVTPELAVLNFPQISVMDNVIIQETTLDFKQYEWLETILPIIRTTLTMAACYAFGHWAIRKVKEISQI